MRCFSASELYPLLASSPFVPALSIPYLLGGAWASERGDGYGAPGSTGWFKRERHERARDGGATNSDKNNSYWGFS